MKTNLRTGFGSLIMRILASVGGALAGSMMVLFFFMLMNFAIISIGPETPMILSSFGYYGITFVSAMFSNVLAAIFLVMADRPFFKGNFRESISRIFFTTVGILAAVSPLYLLLDLNSAHVITRFLMPFTAISTALLLDISADPELPQLAAYKAIYTGMTIAAAFALLFPLSIPFEMMPFFALPIAWLIIPLVSYIVEMIYFSFEKK